jgi:hypothetical protein
VPEKPAAIGRARPHHGPRYVGVGIDPDEAARRADVAERAGIGPLRRPVGRLRAAHLGAEAPGAVRPGRHAGEVVAEEVAFAPPAEEAVRLVPRGLGEERGADPVRLVAREPARQLEEPARGGRETERRKPEPAPESGVRVLERSAGVLAPYVSDDGGAPARLFAEPVLRVAPAEDE